ncbi:hypothetical protein Gotur_025833 [Gossypium turneri]
MVAIIFNIKKFDDVIDFNLWHVQMMGILVQTNLKKLCLANRVLQEVLMEKTSSALWKKVRNSLYDKVSS